MKQTIAVLGGDLRQVWLARLLLEDGCDVVSWGLEQGGGPNPAPLSCALERELQGHIYKQLPTSNKPTE